MLIGDCKFGIMNPSKIKNNVFSLNQEVDIKMKFT